MLDAAPLVANLLTTVAPLRVLVTSRAALRLRGEREYVVGPLTLERGSEALPAADLARSPAVRLFLERVRDVQPQFRLTAANGRRWRQFVSDSMRCRSRSSSRRRGSKC